MTHKKLLRPDRPRQIPPHFSWVDHQLIRQHRLRDCDPSAWALCLFLVTVADAQGLSYYSDASLTRALKVDGGWLTGRVSGGSRRLRERSGWHRRAAKCC